MEKVAQIAASAAEEAVLMSLKQLILDDDFASLESMATEEVNMMSILRVDHKELQHSNLLAWLFDPKGTHNLGDHFIKEFLKLYYKEFGYKDLSSSKTRLSVFDFVELDLSDLEIKREYQSIDLLLLSRQSKLCVVIENKVRAQVSDGQLRRYRELIEREYSTFDHRVYMLLALDGQSIPDEELEHYLSISYVSIRKIIEKILESQTLAVGRNTGFVLEQYLQTLRSLMNENQEIERLAAQLYKKYRPAFDLVYKYAPVYQTGRVPHNLSDLITAHPDIEPFKSHKSYVRFMPKFLKDNIEGLRRKGLISATDDLTDSWIFLFEFNVTASYIHFDMKIGEYNEEPACRERLYALFSAHPDVFTRVKKANNQLRASWHQAYQYKVVSGAEYERSFDEAEGYLEGLIEKRFNTIMTEFLPKLERVLLDHLAA